MKAKNILLLLLLSACSASKQTKTVSQVQTVPSHIEKVTKLPPKDKFYIFIMAGQSNMAGRGIIEPMDTLSSPRILALDANNEWVFAKEPLHYYEPGRTGLDCGLSFAKELISLLPADVTIGIVPCAVGGSAIEQWLGDSLYRQVKLYSNLLQKTRVAASQGTLQALLWHQGESNAGRRSYPHFAERLEGLFTRIRTDLGSTSLPIYAGQLAPFLSRVTNPNADAVNKDLVDLSNRMSNFHIINTLDLTPKSDSIHFDSPSQRKMGQRFARAWYENYKISNGNR